MTEQLHFHFYLSLPCQEQDLLPSCWSRGPPGLSLSCDPDLWCKVDRTVAFPLGGKSLNFPPLELLTCECPLLCLLLPVVCAKKVHSCLHCSSVQFSSVQFSHSVLPDSVTPWIAACKASRSITNSWSFLKLMSIKSVMPSSHLILCRPLLLPPIPPSFRVFSNEPTLPMRWPKYWSFSLSISPSNEHPGLISFRMDWLDLLTVQGTLKSLLQQHSSKTSILQRSTFFIVQLSHSYVTTRKTIALTRQTFVGKEMSLLFKFVV